jgi:hypothetical protein
MTLRMYGIAEIAEALGVRRQVVAGWHHRGRLPEPTAELKMGPVWIDLHIEPWLDAARAAARTSAEGGDAS